MNVGLLIIQDKNKRVKNASKVCVFLLCMLAVDLSKEIRN